MPASSPPGRRPTATSVTGTAASTTGRASACSRRSSFPTTSARGATSCGSGSGATQLAIRTHGGSRTFANPTFTPLTLPNGQPGVVVTQFIPVSGAAPGEAGELVYYRPRDPGPAALADDRGRGRHLLRAEHDLPRRRDVEPDGGRPPDASPDARRQPVRERRAGQLPDLLRAGLGAGEAHHDAEPRQSRPAVVGVHASTSGKPPNYSFDLGAWHLISLDSTNVPAATAFLDVGPRRSHEPVHPRLLASPAVLLRRHARQQRRDGTAVEPPVCGGRRRRAHRARAHLRAVRAADTGRGGEPHRDPPVHRRHRRAGRCTRWGRAVANSEVRIAGIYGVLRMTLHPTSYDWRFQAEDGVTHDSGSTDC